MTRTIPNSPPPPISVVMPVWNGERYLAEAIDSVLTQSYHDFELVIVDDGSEDRTREIVSAYAARDARIRPIYAEHRGLVRTLNEGCHAARGRFIARTDADDVALPERLEQQLQFMESHPDVSLVAAAVRNIDPYGRDINSVVKPPCENQKIRDLLLKRNCLCHSSIMMRTDVWARLGGYRRLYAEAEDYDLWTRFADAHELAAVPDVLVHYRLHPQQVSVTRLEQQVLAGLAIAASTAIRWRTGVEPLGDCQLIDRAIVRGLGVPDIEIDRQIVNAYLRCIGGLAMLGLGKVAIQALREVTSHNDVLRGLADLPVSVNGHSTVSARQHTARVAAGDGAAS